MNACIDPAVNRYNGLEEEVREEFRKTLAAFRNLYSFMSQVIPFQDSDFGKAVLMRPVSAYQAAER